MTDNPLLKASSTSQSGGMVYQFHTLQQMLEECARRNAKEWVIGMERWYFVASPRAAADGRASRNAQIEFVEGSTALEMRARHGQVFDEDWKPEPGETAWIGRAVGEFINRHPQQPAETEAAYRDRFQRQMDRWHAAKPWRQAEPTQDAAG